MPVSRYRDVSDMPPPERGDPAEPATQARIKALWRFATRRLPPLFPPGVYRFRSIADSQAARDTAAITRMRAVRAARRRDPDQGDPA